MKFTKTALAACIAGILQGTIARAHDTALFAPVKSVYDSYLKIEASLAADSMNEVVRNADTIVKAVRGDAKALPPEVASEAADIAKASDLASARAAFKSLSHSLILYLHGHNVSDAYIEIYCPMAKGYWLQTDKNVKNPYFGKAMLEYGEIKN
jgi:hypothetical protein